MRRLRDVARRAALGFLTIAACVSGARAQCAEERFDAALSAEGLCIAFSVHRGDPIAPAAALVIVLHGDVSGGGHADYHRAIAAGFARDVPGAVAVALLRPGYADSEGRSSTGDNNGRRDHYTALANDALAGVIRRLAAHVGAPLTILVGHSGGAALAGVMIGRHPELAQGAVLVACPCDVATWRREKQWAVWNRSLSPHEWAQQVPSTTRVIAITGQDDDNTRSYLAERYVATLKQRGIDARFEEIAGATHNGAFRDPAVVDAIRELAAPPVRQE